MPTEAQKVPAPAIFAIQKTDKEMKWVLLPDSTFEEKVNELINDGRYIDNIIGTTSGYLVIHCENDNNIKQKFVAAEYRYPYKSLIKESQEQFKNGFSLKSILIWGNRSFSIFDLNPKVTDQIILKHTFEKNEKAARRRLKNLNAKGYFFRHLNYIYFIGQKGLNYNPEQDIRRNSILEEKANYGIDTFDSLYKRGWIISSVPETTNWVVISRNNDNKVQDIVAFVGKNNLKEFINSDLPKEYKATAKWGEFTAFTENDYREMMGKIYEHRRNINHDSNNGLMDALTFFSDALSIGTQMFNHGGNSRNAGDNSSFSSMDNNRHGSSSTSRNKNNDSSKSNYNGDAYRNLDRAYSGYEDQLIRMKSNGNYSKSEVRNIQGKMKDIRQKMAKLGGHVRDAAPIESWNP